MHCGKTKEFLNPDKMTAIFVDIMLRKKKSSFGVFLIVGQSFLTLKDKDNPRTVKKEKEDAVDSSIRWRGRLVNNHLEWKRKREKFVGHFSGSCVDIND